MCCRRNRKLVWRPLLECRFEPGAIHFPVASAAQHLPGSRTTSPIRNPFTPLINVCGVRISCHSGSERASIAAIKALRCPASGRQHDILNLAPVSHLGHDLKFVRLAKPEDRAVIAAVRVRSVHNQERTGTH